MNKYSTDFLKMCISPFKIFLDGSLVVNHNSSHQKQDMKPVPHIP